MNIHTLSTLLKTTCLSLIFLAFSAPSSAEDINESRAIDDIEKLFAAHEVEATFVVSSLNGNYQKAVNPKRADIRFSPASTYKIPNTLIGLKHQAILSNEHVFKWDGVKHWLDTWNKDQSLNSAFKVSCVWCYQEFANAIGLEKYTQELKALNYGNASVSEPVDRHWLNGVLTISANEQIDFLKRLVKSELPYESDHIAILKDIMRAKEHSNYTLYTKTGWAAGDLAIGWYVGFIERDTQTFVFAFNMHLDNPKNAPLRKELTIQALQILGIIPKD